MQKSVAGIAGVPLTGPQAAIAAMDSMAVQDYLAGQCNNDPLFYLCNMEERAQREHELDALQSGAAKILRLATSASERRSEEKARVSTVTPDPSTKKPFSNMNKTLRAQKGKLGIAATRQFTELTAPNVEPMRPRVSGFRSKGVRHKVDFTRAMF